MFLRITINSDEWMHTGTTGVIPSEPIRKTPAGCRGFLLSKLLKLELDEHPGYELRLLQDQSGNDGLVPSFAGFSR